MTPRAALSRALARLAAWLTGESVVTRWANDTDTDTSA